MNLTEVIERRETLGGELGRLFQLVMAAESDAFLKQARVKVRPSEEEQEAARREVAVMGGKQKVWDTIKEILDQRGQIGQELRTEIRKVGLKGILPLLDVDFYERLLEATGRIEIRRLSSERREIGSLPAGSEQDVRAIVREFGGGKYQVTHPAVGDSEERREVLEFGGPPKDRELSELLVGWGLRNRQGK